MDGKQNTLETLQLTFLVSCMQKMFLQGFSPVLWCHASAPACEHRALQKRNGHRIWLKEESVSSRSPSTFAQRYHKWELTRCLGQLGFRGKSSSFSHLCCKAVTKGLLCGAKQLCLEKRMFLCSRILKREDLVTVNAFKENQPADFQLPCFSRLPRQEIPRLYQEWSPRVNKPEDTSLFYFHSVSLKSIK